MLNWEIYEDKFDRSRIEINGSKFLLANGYMGCRGTMEEFSKEQFVAFTLAGVYDRYGKGWREPLNAPNGFFTRTYCNGELLSVLTSDVLKHNQILDLRNANHIRETQFKTSAGTHVMIRSERFLSISNVHLACMKYTIKCSKDSTILIETGIDADVWDISGPHLEKFKFGSEDDILSVSCLTHESGCQLAVAESAVMPPASCEIVENGLSIVRRISIETKADLEYSILKYVSVFTGKDNITNPMQHAKKLCKESHEIGYDSLRKANSALWSERWNMSDVRVQGDDMAQLALRYSIYQLLAAAPFHSDSLSIPARGLSSQVYKGAIFWDTEIFMLPFFIYTNPKVAKSLIKYRIRTLDGARRKADEYGFKGAYYAWESQEAGDDACPDFVFIDVFTGRPMRNHFRDKQIHISADIVYSIWMYFSITGDVSIILDGGAEVILECARFYLSYSYFKKDKNRYEILDVVGPDEYHERVNNNAYTNMMIKFTLEKALEILDFLQKEYPTKYRELINKLNFHHEVENIREFNNLLYIPSPDTDTGLIEQFDGYFRLEDISVNELKKRLINPTEYLGGPNGIAVNTQVIKQADVVLMMNLFRDRFDYRVKSENWEYYEKRTEHGSSLSQCVYALVAAELGKTELAYKYFMETATIDLSGKAKQYSGGLYIGGTHTAANGGAWMAAVMGFAGVRASGDVLRLCPNLPDNWEMLSFRLNWRGQIYDIDISREAVRIFSAEENEKVGLFEVHGVLKEVKAGHEIVL